MNMKRTRIAIDARAASHPQPGGFKTYTENLLRDLLQRDDPHSYLLYLDRPLTNGLTPAGPDVSVKIVRGAVPFFGVPFREQVSLPYHLVTDSVDLMHFPCATAALWSPCPFVITIHDTIELMSISAAHARLSAKRMLMHLYNRYSQVFTVHRAAAILTVSENSKRDIVRLFNVSADKVFVTYEAPNRMFVRLKDTQQLDQIRHKYRLGQDFILAIGSADPRKNLNCLIDAYSRLSSDLTARYQLAIVWTHHQLHDDMLALVDRLGLAGRVRFLQAVSDRDLALLYNATSLFVFPSLYEGFGLPPLEAMACGAPVVAASSSSIPEIVGDAALLVDDLDNGAELAASIARALNDESLRHSLSERGVRRAQSFSWDRCAEETVRVYEMVLESVGAKC
jgi:glycosyltransferase involved in cell wall biosynthesis